MLRLACGVPLCAERLIPANGFSLKVPLYLWGIRLL